MLRPVEMEPRLLEEKPRFKTRCEAYSATQRGVSVSVPVTQPGAVPTNSSTTCAPRSQPSLTKPRDRGNEPSATFMSAHARGERRRIVVAVTM